MDDSLLEGAFADEAEIEAANEVTRRLHQEIADRAFKDVISTYSGRHTLWRFLEKAGVYSISFAGENPLTMAFGEGKRHVGLWLLETLFTSDPEVYTLMRMEAQERASRLAQELKKQG